MALKNCPKCGGTLRESSSDCPACLMRAAMGDLEVPDDLTVASEQGDGEKASVNLASDRYRLLDLVGQGGFGEVYLAQQSAPIKRKVAIKILKAGSGSQQVLARFEAERQALAMMEHPGISAVFDAGETQEGQPYFVMEYVDGQPISKFCDAEKMSIEQRLRLFIEVCDAIQHAHQKGVIHRDLKPTNILVSKSHGAPRSKVIDFGIAKALDDSLTDRTLYTEAFQLVGTPAYMSPEQADLSSTAVDTRSDVYSLGVIFYELLTGTTPFQKEEIATTPLDEVLRKLRLEEPARPSARVTTATAEETEREAQQRSLSSQRFSKALNGDLDWITMTALAKEPDRRYESAAAFADDVRRHLADEPIRARPPSVAYRFQKLVRRNTAAFAATALAAVLLIAGSIFSTVQAVRATRAERVASAGEAEYRDLYYFANMNLVQLSWEENDIGRMRRLLEESSRFPEKGFEWFYWDRQTKLHLLEYRGHESGITALATFPDGRRVMTADESGLVKVWDPGSGKDERSFGPFENGVLSVAVSQDSEFFLFGHGDGRVSAWDAKKGNDLRTFLAHTQAVESVTIAHDCSWFATGSRDGVAKKWARHPSDAQAVFKRHESRINEVGIGRDHWHLVTTSWDQTARVWAPGRQELIVEFKGHGKNGVMGLSIAPDARMVATGGWDQTIKLWHIQTGEEHRTLNGHTAPVTKVEFSSDGKRLVSGSRDQTAMLWDVETGASQLTLKGHSNEITGVGFVKNDARIVTASSDGVARVWDTSSRAGHRQLGSQGGHVTSVKFSPNGKMVLSGGGDKVATLWNVHTGQHFRTFRGHENTVRSVDYSPDGLHVLTAGEDGKAKTWVAFTGKELLTIDGHQKAITFATYSPDGKKIATGGDDHQVKIWDAGNGTPLATLSGHGGEITGIEFSRTENLIATSSHDGSIRTWNPETGEQVRLIDKYTSKINSLALSPDGSRILCGGENKVARVWDTRTGEELLVLRGHIGQIWDVAFSPDGSRILTASLDRTAKLWDAEKGREVLTLRDHDAEVWSAAFAPNGRRIATGGWDQKVRVWESTVGEAEE